MDPVPERAGRRNLVLMHYGIERSFLVSHRLAIYDTSSTWRHDKEGIEADKQQ